MKNHFRQLILVCSLVLSFSAKADEGMWIPLLIGQNYEQMKAMGLQLTADQLYSVNRSSLKDAVVNFGNFCSGEMISGQGLLLTNHHCGFDAIQKQSSVEHDYLSDGFWAMNQQEELPNPGLTVTFLIRIEEVSSVLLAGGSLADEVTLKRLQDSLQKAAVAGTHYTAEIKPFFEGNRYFLFVYETFKDVRLVGAPPSSIGKFGGDTDNWMWPRHTGDFSLFRVYCGPDGKPASYSKDNVPFQPRHFLPISLKGIKPGDFTMTLGYPGNTERYMPSQGIRLLHEQSLPMRIRLRETRLAIYKEAMDANPNVRIQYAAKYARVSNYHKYFIGQRAGIERLKVIEAKEKSEDSFYTWRKQYFLEDSLDLKAAYQEAYGEYRKSNPAQLYLVEALLAPEIMMTCYRLRPLLDQLEQDQDSASVARALASWRERMQRYYKDYDKATDQKLFAAMLKHMYEDLPIEYRASVFKEIEKKYKKDFNKYVAYIFQQSFLSDEVKFNAFLNNPSVEMLKNDVAFQCFQNLYNHHALGAGLHQAEMEAKLNELHHAYLKAYLKYKSGALYPDANFTMRLSYGSIQDYQPRDGVRYLHYTTMRGIEEKADSTNPDFVVPENLLPIYKKEEANRYADSVSGYVPVCFLSTNDITGGNSGSPVINGEGQLIGCAFDGNWEAMSGDLVYEKEYQRTISVDIRYILFVIDQFAGAGYLLNEMTIVRN
jgi:hypothetical protein